MRFPLLSLSLYLREFIDAVVLIKRDNTVVVNRRNIIKQTFLAEFYLVVSIVRDDRVVH